MPTRRSRPTPSHLRGLGLLALASLVAGLVAASPTAAAGRQTTPAVRMPSLEPAPGNPILVISTSLGDITVELFQDTAPISTGNFLQDANEGFYAGTVFHRVKPGFVIQGGGYTASLEEKPTRPAILNEAIDQLRNTRGTVAMARKAALRSATSQFYINAADNGALDHTGYSPDEFGYAVFGRVLKGMDVVDRIAAVKTRSVGVLDDVPVEPVVIRSVLRVAR